MSMLKRLEAELEVVLSRWFLAASSPRATAFANPWSPGAGAWRFEVGATRVAEPPFAPFDLDPLAAQGRGAAGGTQVITFERRAPGGAPRKLRLGASN